MRCFCGIAEYPLSFPQHPQQHQCTLQRGDAEMSNKLWRVVRACVELGAQNPIQQIHDQGAGGNCNVVKEIIYPLGAEIDIRAIKLGDETMSVLEIWGAEYQENDALLIKPESRELLQEVCRRERCNMQVCQPTGFCHAHSQLHSVLSLCSCCAHAVLILHYQDHVVVHVSLIHSQTIGHIVNCIVSYAGPFHTTQQLLEHPFHDTDCCTVSAMQYEIPAMLQVSAQCTACCK